MRPHLFDLPWGPANAYGTAILLGTLLTTRMASRVGLGLLVVLTILNLLGFLYQVSVGALAEGVFGVLTAVQAATSLVAVVMLMRPNALAWYRAMAEVSEA